MNNYFNGKNTIKIVDKMQLQKKPPDIQAVNIYQFNIIRSKRCFLKQR